MQASITNVMNSNSRAAKKNAEVQAVKFLKEKRVALMGAVAQRSVLKSRYITGEITFANFKKRYEKVCSDQTRELERIRTRYPPKWSGASGNPGDEKRKVQSEIFAIENLRKSMKKPKKKRNK